MTRAPSEIEMQNEQTGEVTFPVYGGMCRLTFRAGVSTGLDGNTNPGISFDFDSQSQLFLKRNPSPSAYPFYGGHGVIGRDDAQRLADMLDEFLAQHPAE